MMERRNATSQTMATKGTQALLCLEYVAATWSWIFSSGMFSRKKLSSFAALTQKWQARTLKEERSFSGLAHVLGLPNTGDSLELFAGSGFFPSWHLLFHLHPLSHSHHDSLKVGESEVEGMESFKLFSSLAFCFHSLTILCISVLSSTILTFRHKCFAILSSLLDYFWTVLLVCVIILYFLNFPFSKYHFKPISCVRKENQDNPDFTQKISFHPAVRVSQLLAGAWLSRRERQRDGSRF